jgi:hypothetical protein
MSGFCLITGIRIFGIYPDGRNFNRISLKKCTLIYADIDIKETMQMDNQLSGF